MLSRAPSLHRGTCLSMELARIIQCPLVGLYTGFPKEGHPLDNIRLLVPPLAAHNTYTLPREAALDDSK